MGLIDDAQALGFQYDPRNQVPPLAGSSISETSYNDYYDAAFGGNSSANDYQDLNVDVAAEQELIDSVIEGTGVNVSLSEYLKDNPGLNPEDYLSYMAQHSDEYAEKYIDYLLEKKSLEDNNRYSAEREDTAYQRLVEDLRRAGLNPAMMYGSSASPSASNSLGYLKQSEGANSRSIGNFNKLKQLLLGFLSYELYRKLDTTDQITGSFKDITGGIKDLFGAFSKFFS